MTDGTFLSRSQVEDLLQGWASAEVEEREYDGHSFGGPPGTAGIIGPELSDTQRWELIEHLKTL